MPAPVCWPALLAGVTLLLAGPLWAGRPPLIRPGELVDSHLTADDLRLDDGTHCDTYRLGVSEGQRVRLTLIAEAFDAVLLLGYLRDDGRWVTVETADGGGEDTDAVLDTVLQENRPYLVRVNSVERGAVGRYLLVLDDGVGPLPGRHLLHALAAR